MPPATLIALLAALLAALLVIVPVAGCAPPPPPEQPAPPEDPTTPTGDPSGDAQQPSDSKYVDYPTGAAFIGSIINQDGTVAVTDQMRERFNLFARDYRWVYMPDMDGYESFFETDHYADSFGYPNFVDAVFYVLQYRRCPEKMSAEEMRTAIEGLFVSKDGSYEEMPHQAYRKFARYEEGYYSPWPEGGLDHDRQFYLLTALDVSHEGEAARITVRTTTYYFNDTTIYEAGDAEKWLAARAQELGVSDLEAAAVLVASGGLGEIAGVFEFETTIYVNPTGPRGLNPQFVSSRSREIAVEDAFPGE